MNNLFSLINMDKRIRQTSLVLEKLYYIINYI